MRFCEGEVSNMSADEPELYMTHSLPYLLQPGIWESVGVCHVPPYNVTCVMAEERMGPGVQESF